MFRAVIYSLIGIVIGSIGGILMVPRSPTGFVLLTFLGGGAFVGGLFGVYIASLVNRHYRNNPTPFTPPVTEATAPVYLSIAIETVMMVFLLLFVVSLIYLSPSNEALDSFMASPLPFLFDTIAYAISLWIGIWFLKRRGYLDASYSLHSLSAGTVFLVIIGNAVGSWEALLTSPISSLFAFAMAGVVLYGLTRFVLSKVL